MSCPGISSWISLLFRPLPDPDDPVPIQQATRTPRTRLQFDDMDVRVVDTDGWPDRTQTPAPQQYVTPVAITLMSLSNPDVSSWYWARGHIGQQLMEKETLAKPGQTIHYQSAEKKASDREKERGETSWSCFAPWRCNLYLVFQAGTVYLATFPLLWVPSFNKKEKKVPSWCELGCCGSNGRNTRRMDCRVNKEIRLVELGCSQSPHSCVFYGNKQW